MPIPSSDLLTLAPDAIVALYSLNLNPIGVNFTFDFCNWKDTTGNPVVFQGVTYTALPFEVTGMELTSKGNPQPSITISNVFGIVTAIAIQYDDLIGGSLTRKRTLVKYLDGASSANPSMEFPETNHVIWRKSQENALTITYELRQYSDLGFKSKVPQRVVKKYSCGWQYRGADCGYTGSSVATENDTPTTNPILDKCGKRLKSCKLRFGNNPLPFEGFPGVDIV
jgi:lambda family phage minor tail protein L